MKLVVQIPCLNEAGQLAGTIADVPREVEGFAAVEILVIDDGSTDGTSDAAREAGADHVVRLPRNHGLARVFCIGLAEALRLGADVIVNFDADNQYRGADIPKLVAPIVRGEADMVIGDRRVERIEHFSWTKRFLQQLGSWVVRRVSGTDVRDAASGFRALSREAALGMNVVSEFTYTLETIIQAGKHRLALVQVPVETNRVERPSRLFGRPWDYVKRSATSILRLYTHYEPLKTMFFLGAAFVSAGALLGLRFLIYWWIGQGGGKVQSLILAAVFVIVGVQVFLMGLLGDVVAANRRLVEEILYRERRKAAAPPARRSDE